MNGYSALLRTARWGVLVVFAALQFSANAATSYRTNWVERTVTNQIEIRMPRNVFVNEYQTNSFDVFKTNVVTRWQTNHAVVNLSRTNYFDVYRTNWVTRKELRENVIELFRTNFWDVYRTNWTTRIQTNEVAIAQIRTNFVEQYRTNWQAINLTNWQTVVALRTNWIVQPVTNVVEINLPREPGKQPNTRPAATTRVTSNVEPASAPAADDPVIEGSRTSRPVAHNLAEVQLKVRWPRDIADPLPVRHWKIQSEDGAFLCFGLEQQFVRELPLGTYRIEANLYREVDNAALVVYGKLTVNAQQASVQWRAARKPLAAK